MEEAKLDKYYELLKVLRDNDISSEIFLESKKNFQNNLNMPRREVFP